MSEKVKFNSQGETLVGTLTRPANAKGDVPIVVMAGGWCYTKEIVMPYYAKFFQDIGCATLCFDYRNFGESSGEPRQHLNPWEQVEDYRNAFSFAETLKGIDIKRSGIWGISYSGGHIMVVAALDNRPAFAIGTVPVIDGFQTMRRCHGEVRFAQLRKILAADRKARFEGKPSGKIAMSTTTPFADELSTWPYAHVYTAFNDIKAKEAPLHEHWNTIESVELLLAYNVIPFAAKITETPVMIALAAGDNITSHDLEVAAFNAIPNPNKHLANVTGVHHMSLYTSADDLAKVGRRQAEWLKNLLPTL
jgi:cephalosporin-C deacetylase-like acetyl esterase